MRHPPRSSGSTAGADVVLDIGGDVGAVVVELAEVPWTGELHAHAVGHPERRFHTGVHVRATGEVTTPVAIFPAVTAGAYVIETVDGMPLMDVEVTGGHVTVARCGRDQRDMDRRGQRQEVLPRPS